MKFSEKLQKLRKENNLSQEQLADKLDVSRQSVSKWESGQTYPEMDKLLTMCKLFNITLDDLTNDEIDYKEVKPKNKNTFDNLVDDVMYIIDKTYTMFHNMDAKERGKVIGELIILFLVLLMFRLPFEYILSEGHEILYHLPKGAYIFQSLWSFIINIVYLILFVFTFIYIYKTYFLDKYKEKNTEETNPSKEKSTEIPETKDEQIEEKKIIKKEKEKNRGFGTTLYEILGSIVSFCFKAFLVFISIPFIISFIALFIVLFLLIVLLFKEIFYFGFIVCALAALILNWILLKLIASFLFGYKPKFKVMFASFIIGLSLTGIGTGLTILDIASTEIINEAPTTTFEYTTKTLEYDNNINLVIQDYYTHYYNYNNITYEIDNNLQNTIKIELSYYQDLNYFDTREYKEDKYNVLEIMNNERYNKKILDIFLKNLKKKKIYDYSKLYNYTITVVSSENNINTLKNNESEYYKYKNTYIIEESDYYYQRELDNLTRENNKLTNQIDELNNKIYNLEETNNTLKEKIKTYKENLENILN